MADKTFEVNIPACKATYDNLGHKKEDIQVMERSLPQLVEDLRTHWVSDQSKPFHEAMEHITDTLKSQLHMLEEYIDRSHAMLGKILGI